MKAYERDCKDANDKTIKAAMSNAYKTKVAEFGTPISAKEYEEFRTYAAARKIRISGFRNYVGDIETIKTIIDDINEVGLDFPRILDERSGVVLELDFDMKDEDFATTDSGHAIHLNASYFCDVKKLEKVYNEAVKEGDFVSGTDWRAIGRHEAGHVVQNFYQFDVLKIALMCLPSRQEAELFNKLETDLSVYSTAYEDGREIISESFSGFYGRVGNIFADHFVKECLKCKDL